MSKYRKLKKKLGLVLSFVIVFSMAIAGFSWTVFAASGVAAAPTKLSSVAISGTAQVGQQLTAALSPGTATARYQWQSSANGTTTWKNIYKATSSTYTLVSNDATRYIRVIAKGTGSYNGRVTSAYTGPVAVAAALGSDATLKASSTVKGETLLSLGRASASGDNWSDGGTVTITAAEAANTTNLTPYITLFDPTDARATVKVVKYSQWANVGNFDSAPAYANQAITNQDYFWVKVTAPDTTTLYYKVVVTVTP